METKQIVEGCCPACQNWHWVDKNGNLPTHFRKTGSRGLIVCNGSRNKPLMTRDVETVKK